MTLFCNLSNDPRITVGHVQSPNRQTTGHLEDESFHSREVGNDNTTRNNQQKIRKDTK